MITLLYIVRYAIERKTYIVDTCATWLKNNWANLNPNMQNLIAKSVETELASNRQCKWIATN